MRHRSRSGRKRERDGAARWQMGAVAILRTKSIASVRADQGGVACVHRSRRRRDVSGPIEPDHHDDATIVQSNATMPSERSGGMAQGVSQPNSRRAGSSRASEAAGRSCRQVTADARLSMEDHRGGRRDGRQAVRVLPETPRSLDGTDDDQAYSRSRKRYWCRLGS